VVIFSECGFVFAKHLKKNSFGLSHTSLAAVGQLILYTPQCVYLSVLFVSCLLFMSMFWIVLLLRHAIFNSVFFNKFVMCVIFCYVVQRGPHLYGCVFRFV